MDERVVSVITVTDLHQDRGLVDQLKTAVWKHRPDVVAFVGDFLDGTGSTYNRYSVEDCAINWAALEAAGLLFVPGNHDFEQIDCFKSAWRQQLNLKQRCCHEVAPLQIVCFPCLMGDSSDDVHVSARPMLWLPHLLKKYGNAARFLWLMHEPPRGTILSQQDGVLAGNDQWMQMIERYGPRVVVFGHDHNTSIRRKIWNVTLSNGTVCVCLGQDATLRYALLRYKFAADQLVQLRITAYPAGEEINVPV